jgi:hypothetical protein
MKAQYRNCMLNRLKEKDGFALYERERKGDLSIPKYVIGRLSDMKLLEEFRRKTSAIKCLETIGG